MDAEIERRGSINPMLTLNTATLGGGDRKHSFMLTSIKENGRTNSKDRKVSKLKTHSES